MRTKIKLFNRSNTKYIPHMLYTLRGKRKIRNRYEQKTTIAVNLLTLTFPNFPSTKGVLPFRGMAYYVAPLSFLYDDAAKLYAVFRMVRFFEKQRFFFSFLFILPTRTIII